MIQGFTKENFGAYLSLEDNRIDTSAPISKIRFLVKFINDMTGGVEYVYPLTTTNTSFQRYTQLVFNYALNPDMYNFEVNLLPSGHWKYEVYEVSWLGIVNLAFGNAPATETDVLPVADTNGIVNGIVTKGILNLTEKAGTEQVQYDQHESPDSPNYVWYGTDIDVWNPADEASIVAFYKNKTGLTLVGGKVKGWDDSSSNTFDMVQSTVANQPSYTASTGGVIFSGADFMLTGASSVTIPPATPFLLDAEFTIGFKIKATSFTGIILSETLSAVGNFKLDSSTILSLATTTGSSVSLTTTTGTWEDAYVVITRNAANLISLSVNGVLQTGTVTKIGDFRFNLLGSQNVTFPSLDGSIFELQVYSSTSPTLTDNINERLSNL